MDNITPSTSTTEKTVSPLRSIRRKCLDCVGSSNEVRLCPVSDCAIFPYRFGKNPNRPQLSEAEKQRRAEQLKLNRKNA